MGHDKRVEASGTYRRSYLEASVRAASTHLVCLEPDQKKLRVRPERLEDMVPKPASLETEFPVDFRWSATADCRTGARCVF